jgi:hypothetical protein
MRKFVANNRKLMAIFASGLMVVFTVVGFTQKNDRPQATAQVVGTIFGQPVTSEALTSGKQEWELLKTLRYKRDVNSEPEGLFMLVLFDGGNPLMQERQSITAMINAKTESFYLLKLEAQHLGITADNDEVMSMISNHIEVPENTDMDRLQAIVSDAMTVKALLDRVGDVVKVSRPFTDYELYRRAQKATVAVADFNATEFFSKTRPPTTQEAQAQYDQYANHDADVYDTASPMGIGYKYPNRVQLQYIGLIPDDALTAVVNAKTDLDWEVAARREYRLHRENYPVTRPTTLPTTAATADTRPISPEYDALPDDVHKKVVDKVKRDAASELANKVQKRMFDILNTDYASWHQAQSQSSAGASAPKPVSVVGTPYDSPYYMARLAKFIQAELGVMPTTADLNDGWKSRTDLAKASLIGSTVVELRTGQPVDFPSYATLLGEAFPEAAGMGDKLNKLQPSLVTHDLSLDEPRKFFFFRLTAMDPAHAATFDEVRTRIDDDFRLIQAYGIARDQAGPLFDAARQQGLAAAAPAFQRVITTAGPFSYSEQLDKIPNYPMKTASIHAFADAVVGLMAEPGSPKHGPVALVLLPADARVAVVQLLQVENKIDTPELREFSQMQLSSELSAIFAVGLARQWAEPTALVQRTGFKVDESKHP